MLLPQFFLQILQLVLDIVLLLGENIIRDVCIPVEVVEEVVLLDVGLLLFVRFFAFWLLVELARLLLACFGLLAKTVFEAECLF